MRMRLGKTLVAIRGANWYKPRNPKRGLAVLVLAPPTVLYTWQKELAMEMEDSVCLLTGTKDERMALLGMRYKWYLLNFEGVTMRRGKRITGPAMAAALAFQNAVAAYPWDLVLVDESVRIKNPKANVTKFVTNHFRRVPHKAILTGMPTPESDLDVFEQLRFLDGRVLGFSNFWSFRSKCFNQILYDWHPKPSIHEKLVNYISQRAYVLQREDVGMDQPKVREQRMLTMPTKVRKTYNTAEAEFVLEHDGKLYKTSLWQGAKYTWLRMLCGGFIKDAEGNITQVWKGPVGELVTLLRGELARERVVVWFAFNHELHACREALTKAGISNTWADGSVPKEERQPRFDDFNAGKYRAILVQVKLGQYGINLSGASAVIYFSNPLDNDGREQSEDRCIDITKTTAALIIDFCVKNTVSEDIFYMLRVKAAKSGRFMRLARAIHERRKRLGY